jgi:large subunit ribosomal protein L4
VQATVYNLAGEEVEKIDLDDAIFGITPNMAVIQQAVLRQQANARQGTHDTKTRADVRGGGRKPWRQKGTGRARQGSTRSPQWRHGGIVFGPHPRSYVQDMPRKMRRLAIRSVLSAKAADGQLVLVDSFDDIEPRTKAMSDALSSLNVGENSALIMTADLEPNLEMAAANLKRVKTLSAHLLSIVDMLKHDYLVMPRASLEIVHNILANGGGRRKLTLRGATAEAAVLVSTEPKPAKKATKSKAAKAEAAAPAEVAAPAETETKEARPAKAKATKETAKPKAATEAKAEAIVNEAKAQATQEAAKPKATAAKPKARAAGETKSKSAKKATKPKAAAEAKPIANTASKAKATTKKAEAKVIKEAKPKAAAKKNPKKESEA